jgi:ADP-ribosyl-[dinitrogen reductase] hydrolase
MSEEYVIGVKALPLMINSVTVPDFPGVIGISSCPGMKVFSTLDLYEDRIDNDLQSIRNWGASTIVSLLEISELAMLGITDLPDKAHSMNLLWLHLPIRNMGLPDETFEESWRWAGPKLLKLLKEGQRILVHCKEGIGRSGIVAARLLIESGVDPGRAMKTVRKARPGSLVLNAHEDYCHSLADRIASDKKVAGCYVMPRSAS